MAYTYNYNLGRVLPIFKGTYSSTTNYVPLDIVYYNGSSYVCKQNAQNKVPTNTTYWQIVALKGELSPTLSPAQVNSIIQQIESESNFVIDANYVHTDNNFSTAYKDAVDALPEAIGDATITIQRNGVNVGTFTTNSTANKTINLQVPTQISDLSGDSSFITIPKVISSEKTTIDIHTLKDNTVYLYTKPVTVINIVAFEYGEPRDSFKLRPSIVDFYTGDIIDSVKLPDITFFEDEYQRVIESIKQPNTHYRLIFDYNVLTVKKLYKQ